MNNRRFVPGVEALPRVAAPSGSPLDTTLEGWNPPDPAEPWGSLLAKQVAAAVLYAAGAVPSPTVP